MKQQKLPLDVRFWKHVQKTDSCWLWMGRLDADGYGMMRNQERAYKNAHKISWILHFGELPKFSKVSQKCGVKNCVNPDHLQLGRACENLTDLHQLERFSDRTGDCWIWKSTLDSDGYGKLRLPKTRLSRLAHRVSWQVYKGAIPTGLCVLHRCDVRNCINPDHLFLGTNRDNSDDMVSKQRQARGSKNAHSKLTEADVVQIRQMYDSNGHSIVACQKAFPKIQRNSMCDIVYRRAWKHV